jgi:hypothetical protein
VTVSRKSLHLVLTIVALLAARAAEETTSSSSLKHLHPTLEATSTASVPSPSWLEQARPVLGSDLELARRAQLLDGSLTTKDGEAIEVRIATVPLRAPLDGALLGVAVDSQGDVVASGLWGRPELEEDTLQSWRFLLSQFTRQPSMNTTIAVANAAPASEGEALARRIRAGELDATRDALYRMRLLMRDNSYRFTVRHRLPAGSEPVWLFGLKGNFDALSLLAPQLESVLGESTTHQFRQAARKGSELLAEAVTALEAGDQPAVRGAARRLYRESCETCHQLENSSLGEAPIYFALMNRLESLGVRGDVAKVGVDVYPIPDAPPAASQEVATALRTALLVLDDP